MAYHIKIKGGTEKVFEGSTFRKCCEWIFAAEATGLAAGIYQIFGGDLKREANNFVCEVEIDA